MKNFIIIPTTEMNHYKLIWLISTLRLNDKKLQTKRKKNKLKEEKSEIEGLSK